MLVARHDDDTVTNVKEFFILQNIVYFKKIYCKFKKKKTTKKEIIIKILSIYFET